MSGSSLFQVGEPKVELACMGASLDRPHATLFIWVLVATV